MPNALTKQAAASAADSASSAPTAGTRNFRPQCGSSGLSRIAWKVSHSETKPLSGGSAEIATQPTRKAKAVSGMRMDEPAEMLHVALAGAVSTAPAPKNNRLLKSEWLSTWNSAAVKASAAADGMPVGLEGERKPEPDEDDADILDRVIGEQPLQIVLHQRVEHAHDAGDAGERQHHHAPPPSGVAEQVEDDADEGVDRDLGHDAAHQGRDMARRRRMGERQPDMQRHETRLRAGADQGEDEDERGKSGGGVALADRVEGVSALRPGEQAEGEQQRERAEARHDQIDVAGAHVLGFTGDAP